VTLQDARERPRGTLRLSPAKPKPDKPSEKPKKNRRSTRPRSIVNNFTIPSDKDIPKFLSVTGGNRNISVRPSEIAALVEGIGDFDGKTWCFPNAYEQDNKKCRAIPLDTHFAIISFGCILAFQTPQRRRRKRNDANMKHTAP
jgi:hypothetical protein